MWPGRRVFGWRSRCGRVAAQVSLFGSHAAWWRGRGLSSRLGGHGVCAASGRRRSREGMLQQGGMLGLARLQVAATRLGVLSGLRRHMSG